MAEPLYSSSNNLLFVNTLSLLEKMLQRYGSLSGKLHMIELEKDSTAHGLGVSLIGNKEGSRARMSVYVADIDPQGPAGLDGRIQVGDELLEVRRRVKANKDWSSLTTGTLERHLMLKKFVVNWI